MAECSTADAYMLCLIEFAHVFNYNRNPNRKLDISTAPTKARSREPAYSQALIQNKIDRQRVRSRESDRQTVRRLWGMMFGVETGREVGRKRTNQDRIC